MNYLILINKDNELDKTYIPSNLKNSNSLYKDNILINEKVLRFFNKLSNEALTYSYTLDIMSGYRSFSYQEKLYSKLLHEKGINYTFRYLAKPGCSEHQTGLAIDICVYRDNNCFVEKEIESFEEIIWLHKNAHRFGFILRYPYGKEDLTGYNYEPWHFRYVGNMASYLYYNGLTLEEYYKKACKQAL